MSDSSKQRRSKSYLRQVYGQRWRIAIVTMILFVGAYYYYASTLSIRTKELDLMRPATNMDKNINLRGGDDFNLISDSQVPAASRSDKPQIAADGAAAATTDVASSSNSASLIPLTKPKPTALKIDDPDTSIDPDTSTIISKGFNKKKDSSDRSEIAQLQLKHKVHTPPAATPAATPAVTLAATKKLQAEIKKKFDDGYENSGMPPFDFGTDTEGGPDGKRDYGKHPHYMAKCHSCTHHKFTYVAIEGNHEPEIVKNLGRVMCAMKNLPPDCGQHFIEHDCTPFTAFDNRDWFAFTFAANPYQRAISSWTMGLEHDIRKAGITHKNLAKNLQKEERYCGFRRWVLWAMGMDRTASMSCPFNKPDLQVNAIYTKEGTPALNFVGRIEHYTRDMTSILQLIDPSGNMVRYHEQHAKEFALHPLHHPHDWKSWYRDHKIPDIWKLVGRMYKEDIEKLGYAPESM